MSGRLHLDYPVAGQLAVGTNPVEDQLVLIVKTKGYGRRVVI